MPASPGPTASALPALPASTKIKFQRTNAQNARPARMLLPRQARVALDARQIQRHAKLAAVRWKTARAMPDTQVATEGLARRVCWDNTRTPLVPHRVLGALGNSMPTVAAWYRANRALPTNYPMHMHQLVYPAG